MALRILADDPTAGGSAAYLGIAAILTAATGLIGAVAALIRVLRAPVRHEHDDEAED